MLYSIIDIGSNTVKLAVYTSPSPKPIYFLSKQIALADYVSTSIHGRTMTNEGIDLLKKTLLELKNKTIENGYPLPQAFCTAACRNLINETDLIAAISTTLGRQVRILSGQEEALFTLRGVLSSVSVSNGIMIDMGGASTEFCPFENKQPVGTPISIPCGCRHLYHVYQKTHSKISLLEHFYHASHLPQFTVNSCVCLSGGSVKALAKAMNDNRFDANTQKDVQTFISSLLPILELADSSEDRICREIFKERYPLMFPSLVVFDDLLKKLSPTGVHLSFGGTREGYYLSLI